MKKKILVFVTALVMMMGMSAVPSMAAKAPLLDDTADVLTDDEEAMVTEALEEVSEKTSMDVAVQIIYDYEGDDLSEYAQAYWDEKGYGPDGLVLVVDPDGPEWSLVKAGKAYEEYTEDELKVIMEDVDAYIKDRDYTEAFRTFAEGFTGSQEARTLPLLVDDADVVPAEDEEALQQKLTEVSDSLGLDIVIHTTDSFGDKTPTEYADDYYDYTGYSEDGLMLALDMTTRDYAITTDGSAIDSFPTSAQENVMNDISDSLGEDDYVTAFNDFADDVQSQIEGEGVSGRAIDNLLEDIVFALAIGLGIALLIVRADKNALKSVRHEPAAKNYIREGSFDVKHSSERFLYSNVVRTRIEHDNDTHTSSSGDTHGGSSGKF